MLPRGFSTKQAIHDDSATVSFERALLPEVSLIAGDVSRSEVVVQSLIIQGLAMIVSSLSIPSEQILTSPKDNHIPKEQPNSSISRCQLKTTIATITITSGQAMTRKVGSIGRAPFACSFDLVNVSTIRLTDTRPLTPSQLMTDLAKLHKLPNSKKGFRKPPMGDNCPPEYHTTSSAAVSQTGASKTASTADESINSQ